MATFSWFVTHNRENMGLSRKDLAEKARVPETVIESIEQDPQCQVDKDIAVRIADVFGVGMMESPEWKMQSYRKKTPTVRAVQVPRTVEDFQRFLDYAKKKDDPPIIENYDPVAGYFHRPFGQTPFVVGDWIIEGEGFLFTTLGDGAFQARYVATTDGY